MLLAVCFSPQSHLFVLHLVHRPTVRSVLQGLLHKRLLPTELGAAKARRIVQGCCQQQRKEGNAEKSGESKVDQTSMKVR